MVATSTTPSGNDLYSPAIAFCEASASRVINSKSVIPRVPAGRFNTIRSMMKSARYITNPRTMISKKGASGRNTELQSTELNILTLYKVQFVEVTSLGRRIEKQRRGRPKPPRRKVENELALALSLHGLYCS